ncbi:hypothetical protein BDV96DRAFT_647722 [Lophiotrema nucula]|uniref:NACHT domain-containing protein n=1 Tax=Lophiotrema nucula TaxID=690887 RepID=A0A6A5Z575_9PLEO|nr:hypothetical protein BDV96DRAFT_647722 [Lophiotrema nucula]
MEALAAVGLAGNVVQFVDFTCKLFDRATAIHHSQAGAAHEDLELITQNLQDLSTKLHQGSHQPLPSSNPTPSHAQASLKKLGKDCEVASDELLSALQRLKATKPGSRWSSFRAALASAWKEKHVEAMEKRLNSYRSQLVLQLQVMQSDEKSEILLLLDGLSDKSRHMGVALTDQISLLRSEMQHAIQTLRISLEAQNSRLTATPKSRKKTQNEEFSRDISALVDSLVRTEASGANLVVALALLGSLKFEYMEYRHSKILEAHPQTFAWVISNKFAKWLRSSEPIFWISGKPGSGKSTLMKYLVDNPETPSMLHLWNDSDRQVIASYFFWVNGTEMQRSQEGLLRSILYEFLRQCPTHVETVMPELWKEITALLSQDQRPIIAWKRKDLLACIRRLSMLDVTGVHLFVFIDGLDEYKGDHDELIETIRYLSTMSVKMCVASRPWNVFEEAFGEKEDCKIYLQDLNKPDIRIYVNDKLRSRRELQPGRADVTAVDLLKVL